MVEFVIVEFKYELLDLVELSLFVIQLVSHHVASKNRQGLHCTNGMLLDKAAGGFPISLVVLLGLWPL